MVSRDRVRHGATLNIAVGKAAYVLAIELRGLNFANKQDFKIHVRGQTVFSINTGLP